MRSAIAATLALLPAAAMAQGTSGIVEGTLNYEDARWTIREEGDALQSGWRETDQGIEVELHATPEGDTAPEEAEQVLSITFTLSNGATSSQAIEPLVEYVEGSGPTPLTAYGENLTMELGAIAQEGERLTVTGDVNATLTYGTHNEMILDPGSEATEFDATFQATIDRLE